LILAIDGLFCLLSFFSLLFFSSLPLVLDNGTNERAGCIVLSAVAPRIAHILDLCFIEMGKLVLFSLRAKPQLINVINDLTQVVPALDLVFDLAEDLTNLVFDGVRPGGFLCEAMQVRKQLLVDEVAKVITGHGLVVVELAVLALRRRPGFPAIGFVEDVGVSLAV
jgi:hypothetical protein